MMNEVVIVVLNKRSGSLDKIFCPNQEFAKDLIKKFHFDDKNHEIEVYNVEEYWNAFKRSI